jgi:DNA (cytosine-5)-methyltransferase 1
MAEPSLKAIDLYSGVGGLSLGGARAGLSVVLAVENDPEASEAHTRNFRATQHLSEDISGLTAPRLRLAAGLADNECFAVIGGPPCQGFSTMGHRRPDDPRNHLFSRFFELVAELQPILFVAENVPGIMDEENAPLREHAFTFVNNDYVLLDPLEVAAAEYGAPTTRRRFFFIGYKDDYFAALSPNFFRAGRTRVTVGEALRGLPQLVRSDWQREEQSWRPVAHPDEETHFWRSVRGRCPDGVGDPKAIKLLAEQSLVSGFLGTRHTEAVKRRFAVVGPGQVDRVSKARRLELDGFCPTLRAGTGADRGSYQAVRPIHPSKNRVIVPREAARLQGFPDWFQFSSTKWHSFRQIGNSVCPLVAEKVIATILAHRRR